MTITNQSQFNCQLYVSVHGHLSTMLPIENGPQRVITFAAVEFDDLIEPGFRRLLAAFDSVPGLVTI